MAENPIPSKFEFDLGDYGDVISISSPQEFTAWIKNELDAWKWVNISGIPQVSEIYESHHRFYANQLQNLVNQWTNSRSNPGEEQRVLASITAIFRQYYCEHKIFHSSNPAVVFLSELRKRSGDVVAAGAYVALLRRPINGSPIPMDFFDGMLEGFLYEREIDWTASAHVETLNRLRKQYENDIARQDVRFKEIEVANNSLTKTFEETLKQRSESLQKLHGDQSSDFQKQVEEHVKNLKAIELTYDQKLALQKPVEYWKSEERRHRRYSKVFGIAALFVMAALGTAMGFLVKWVFGNLAPTENPKHWQIGIILVTSFFSIWLLRILVRIFLSHLHLATDSAERCTMILTYLSMSREGAPFSAQDKTIILQHLFRSASDGLVKDDAAPPSPLEFLTRK